MQFHWLLTRHDFHVLPEQYGIFIALRICDGNFKQKISIKAFQSIQDEEK
jgi:hypothetical protein